MALRNNRKACLFRLVACDPCPLLRAAAAVDYSISDGFFRIAIYYFILPPVGNQKTVKDE
jgi:hypothetical protein